MSLEPTVNVLADLDSSWPTGTDGKSQGDDHLRNIKKALRQSFPGFTGAVAAAGVTTGSSNAYVLTPATALTAYAANMGVVINPNFSNTGAATLNISGLGAKNIKRPGGVDVASGELASGVPVFLVYDGTQFIVPFPTYGLLTSTAFSSVLPSQSGNANKFVTTNGTSASWDWDGFKGRVSTTVATYSFSSSDWYYRMKWVAFSDGGTVTLPAANIVGSKWMFRIGNEHASALIVLTAFSGQTVNGASSINIAPNEVWDVWSDGGTAMYAHRVTANDAGPHVIAEEQYASGTAPTAGTNSAYNTRNINTLVKTVSGASLSAGALTLPPGRWMLRAWCISSGQSGSGAMRIRNSSDSSTVANSNTSYWSGTNTSQQTLYAEGETTITSSKNFVISHYLSGTGFGFAAGIGQTEVFARLTATRLGG